MEYGYDTRHRLTSIVHKDASNNTVLDSFTFTLDTEGNITQVLNADGTKFVYTYDQRHRVTEGDLKDGGNNILRTYGYTYDAANNLTAKTRTVTSPYSSNSWVYAYDNANEQTSVTLNGGTPETRSYDDWGRMATRTQGPSSATFGYRYGGRQYSYATNFGGEAPETLQYRGDGRLYSRASGATTKVFRYDRGWNAIDEEDGAGNLTATSVYAPGAAVGERLAWVSGTMLSGTWDYAYHDQLGSTRRWRSATKALLGADDFGPFGEPLATSTVAPIDYALHAQDPYTLMYHAAYREYAAGWARWTTRDPLGMVDGPNVYGYVGDAPISWTDLLGLCCPDDPDTTKGSPDVAACKDKIDALTTKANLALDLAETAALAGCLRVPSWQGKLLCTAAVTTTCSLTRSKIAKLDAEEKHRCEIDPCGLLPNVDAPINLPLPSSPPYTFTP